MNSGDHLIVSCKSWQEAQRVADHLLSSGLVSHAEFFDASRQTSQHIHEPHKEIKLMLTCYPGKAAETEAEIANRTAARVQVKGNN